MNKYQKGDIVLLANGIEAKIVFYSEKEKFAQVIPLDVLEMLMEPAYVKREDIIRKLK